MMLMLCLQGGEAERRAAAWTGAACREASGGWRSLTSSGTYSITCTDVFAVGAWPGVWPPRNCVMS